MQGRLSPIYNNKIQSFQHTIGLMNLKNEELNINSMEWTLDHSGILKNPINTDNGIKKIIQLKKKYKIKIDLLQEIVLCKNLLEGKKL